MTNYECGRALVYIAEQIIKTFGKDFGLEVQELKQESAEPLIKDEKIRKAVRAWAEANDVNLVRIAGVRTLESEHQGIEIEFNTDLFVGWKTALKTIDELCGKGENDGMY